MPLPDLPPGLERRANTMFDAAVSAIAAAQPGVLAAEGRYFQGLASHSSVPSSGADVSQDRLAAKPADRARSWDAAGIAIPQGPVRVRCDEYLGPLGAGYIVTGEIEVAGLLWTRVESVGPEDRGSHEWAESAPDGAI